MIEVTSFLLKHLYEFMADNYAVDAQEAQQAAADSEQQQQLDQEDDQRDEECSIFYHYFASIAHHLQGQPSGEQQLERPAEPESQRNLAASFGAPALRCQHGRPRAALLRAEHERRLQRASANQREQEANQQIVSFLTYNQLPDLACDTFIELLFICVFLAISWIFVMIIQLHCYQSAAPTQAPTVSVMNQNSQNSPNISPNSQNVSQKLASQRQQQVLASGAKETGGQHQYQSARHFYCNTRYLNSLMYCNNKQARQLAF